MISQIFNGEVTVYDNDFIEGDTIAINMDVLFARGANFYVKLDMDVFAKRIKNKSIMFFGAFVKPEKLISDSTEMKRIKAFIAREYRFKIVFLSKMYASPCIDAFTGCKLIIGYPGVAEVINNSKAISYNDSESDLNLASNLGVKFSTISDFIAGNNEAVIINNTPFKPSPFFEYKRTIYVAYDYNLDDYMVNNIECVYVAGPPSFGKTMLARFIENKWKYTYGREYRSDLKKSQVIDANPICKADFTGADRIFSIRENEASEDQMRLISQHMVLLMKRFYKSKHYDYGEVIKYFEVKECNRYPKNANVYYFDFIPYQLFSKNKYKETTVAIDSYLF